MDWTFRSFTAFLSDETKVSPPVSLAFESDHAIGEVIPGLKDGKARLNSGRIERRDRGPALRLHQPGQDRRAATLFPTRILDPASCNDARIVAPGWDPYMLEQEWRNWLSDYDMGPPREPDKAYIGFCRKWAERRGSP